MKEMRIREQVGDEDYAARARKQQHRLDKQRKHLEDAFERRRNMKAMDMDGFGLETDISLAMEERAIVKAEQNMFDLIDQQAAANRERDRIARAKKKVNFASLDREEPKLALGVKEKTLKSTFGVYKHKIGDDGEPFWVHGNGDHLEGVESLLGGNGSVHVDDTVGAVEPGAEEDSWLPKSELPQVKWYVYHKWSLLATAFFVAALVTWVSLPASLIYPDDPIIEEEEPEYPPSDPTGEIKIRLKMDFQAVSKVQLRLQRELAVELALTVGFGDGTRFLFERGFKDVTASSLLAAEKGMSQERSSNTVPFSGAGSEVVRAGETPIAQEVEVKSSALLSHLQPIEHDGILFDPRLGTIFVFRIDGSSREGPPYNESAPLDAMETLFKAVDDKLSRLYLRYHSSRISGIELPDGRKSGCVENCIEDCYGHGTRNSAGACICDEYYNTSSMKPGKPNPNLDCSVACSGLGDVRQEGCVCEKYVTGHSCDVLCSGKDRGTLQVDGTCSCVSPPWTGSDCSVACSNRGTNNPDGSCSCYDKLSGSVCEEQCNGNGVWRQDPSVMDWKTGQGVTNCTCNYPYEGLECTDYCSGHGTISSPFQYVVAGVGTLVQCCDGVPCDENDCAKSGCGGVTGVCQALTQCECQSDYWGWKCEAKL